MDGKTGSVSQKQLEALAEAQAAVWSASGRAARLSEQINHQITLGAEIEPGGLYFDRSLRMARSRKAKEA